ncbi:MAG TPA: alpha-hydroxy acid oxidase [Solirubrobacterales bacterium]|nr:alpha-hydroxy acid oxidase [Solirubrobacterales bacterium]
MAEPVCVADFEALAEERVPEDVWCYFAGGAEDEVTLRANRAAFSRWQFRPRMLNDVAEVTTATEILGTRVSLPILAAPTAMHRLLDPAGEAATARACAAAGTLMCVSTITTCRHEEIAAAAPGAPRWQQVYILADRGRTEAHLDEAADCGYSALVLTVDTPYWARRERDVRFGFRIPPDLPLPYVANDEAARASGIAFVPVSPSVSWRDVEWLAGRSGLPVLVKGVLTREDAELAVEAGAAGVIVSNHGGRQLDCAPASLDALPEVVAAVAGRVPVLMDGGVRRGTDALKAIALGAEAVLVGRPLLFGLAARGEDGVGQVLELLRAELERALALLGCRSPAEVTRAHVQPVPS